MRQRARVLRRGRSAVCLVALWLAQLGATARAQDPPVIPPAGGAQDGPAREPAAPPPDPRLEEAKTLFRQGNELRRAGDWQGALGRYQRSRALVPSLPNTLNAAICLDQLRRDDEALELYEEVLTAFPAEITEEVRQHVARAMARVRPQLGAIDVSANVDGVLVIDGRMRGRLPLLGPVRVLPGTRRVLVIMDGYEPFERAVSVSSGQNMVVPARLAPLRAAGRLRVEEPTLTGGEVYVDGALIGRLPWEGTLAPGVHVLWARKESRGTAPRAVVVLEGQTVRVPLSAAQLGAELRVVVSPASAEISVDGTRIASGSWRGRLPLGRAVFEAREPGYITARAAADVTTSSAPDITLELRADPAHPRWKTATARSFYVELMAGPSFATSLGSGAESNCGDGCGASSMVLGGMAAAHAGYELGSGISLEVALGYVRVGRDLSRSFRSSFRADLPATPEVDTKSVRYDFEDALRLSGPFVAAGAAYRLPLAWRLEGLLRFGAGALLVSSSDAVRGRVHDDAGDSREVDVVVVEDEGNVIRTAALLLTPQLGLQLAFGRWHLGAGVAGMAGVTSGPDLATGETQVRTSTPCRSDDLASLSCAPGERFIAAERSFGPFLLWTPYISARLDL